MDFYKGDIPILDAGMVPGVTNDLFPAGAKFGLVQRDFVEYPRTAFGAPPSEMELIDPSEWDARFDEQEATESALEHIFLRDGQPAFVNLDQNGDGDCWAYSTAHAWMLAHLRDYGWTPRLNPHFIASYLRRFDGGWCGASAKVLSEVGCVTEGTNPDQWPLHLHDGNRARQPEVLAAASANKSGEEWRDLTRDIWDQSMTARQLATCGFLNVPAPSDFNWWGHWVCQVRWVRVERGSWGPLILNSWKGWGRFGLAVLRGSQATANGAVAIRTTK
jgi:hypothetical protein